MALAGVDVTGSLDIVVGVPNDGLTTGGDNNVWPPNELPPFICDNQILTKFLHFKGNAEPTGVRITPAMGPTIVAGLTFTTANDAEARDPVEYELSGSNVSIDGPYTLIHAGPISDFDGATVWPRRTKGTTPIEFANTVSYEHYQLMFPTVRDPAAANSMQVAEVELLMDIVKASDPVPADGAAHEQTWATLGWTLGAFAVSHDVYIGENFDDVKNGTGDTFQGNNATNYFVIGFTGFPFPDGLVSGTTYYWRVDEINDANPDSPWVGDVWSFTVPPTTAWKPYPPDAGKYIVLDADLSWNPGWGAKLHTVYFGDNFDDVNNATGGTSQIDTSYILDPLELGTTYYWRVDEFYGFETLTGEVWSFTAPGAVGSANPYNGAENVKQTQLLRWVANDNAGSHQVYFGTDKDAVRNATTASPEYKGSKNPGDEKFDPGLLEQDAAYYWRIDEVNNLNPNSPWKGNVWAFTTADFLVVDDIESYNDIDPPNPGSNTIFGYWIDGYGTETNGALVGNDLPPYTGQTIVHGGRQSMPYVYDVTGKYAEATLTLDSPRDWTASDVKTLTIWFHGNMVNDAAPIYVAIANTTGTPAVVSHEDPSATRIHAWTQWDIPLQAFADKGIDLANVNSIAIGIGDKAYPPGGSGKMYFDDIGLHPLPPEPEPAP